ncbi:MAG: hypothetical protein P4K98_09520 [Bryobacteraceae bacterium]|nr:hypothetical protein [Bryobacteraceae bacterium]
MFEDILSGPKLRDARTGGRFWRNPIEARLDGRERAPYAEGGWLAMTRQQLLKTLLALGLLLFRGVCTDHCPISLDVGAMVRSGVMRNDECVLCGNIAVHCPTQAIRLTFSTSA